MASLDFTELETKLKKTHGAGINECDVMSAALYPKVAADFFKFRAKYGPVVSIEIRNLLLEQIQQFQIEVNICINRFSNTLYYYRIS